MRIVIIEFMSLDGVVQAPGGPGRGHRRRLHPRRLVASVLRSGGRRWRFRRRTRRRRRAAVRAAHVADDGCRLARPGGRPVRRSDERHREVRRLVDAGRGRADVEQHHPDPGRRGCRAHPRAARRRRRRPGRDGQPDAGPHPAAARASPTSCGSIVMPVLLGGGKTHLPGRRRAAHARARLGGHERRGRAGVHLQAGGAA